MRVETLDPRPRVVLSTSTLHNSFLFHLENPSIHINLETICGGKVEDLLINWENLYLNIKKPIDVIVALLVWTTFLTLRHMKLWKFQMSSLPKKNVNTFTFAEMMRPPRPKVLLMSTEWTRTNHLEKINQVKRYISVFNRATNKKRKLSFVSRVTCSRGNKQDKDGNLLNIMHNFSDWRDDVYKKGLHLSVLKCQSFRSYLKYRKRSVFLSSLPWVWVFGLGLMPRI